MKAKITPTQHEIVLDDSDIIVSKTDLKGRITYVNRVFMRVSNFPEKTLLHQQHNIIRHPDMPRGTFKLLWDTLEAGQEFFAYVKNLTSDGHFYWVYANVTPDIDELGRVVGYFSVRRKPKPSAIAAIQPIYREMLEAERQAGPARAVEASVALLNAKMKGQGTTYERFIIDL
jgi:aerotaxis receptor